MPLFLCFVRSFGSTAINNRRRRRRRRTVNRLNLLMNRLLDRITIAAVRYNRFNAAAAAADATHLSEFE